MNPATVATPTSTPSQPRQPNDPSRTTSSGTLSPFGQLAAIVSGPGRHGHAFGRLPSAAAVLGTGGQPVVVVAGEGVAVGAQGPVGAAHRAPGRRRGGHGVACLIRRAHAWQLAGRSS